MTETSDILKNMSSAAYLEFSTPITAEQWAKFCQDHDVEFSPNTVGHNVFYWKGLGGVEIKFGEFHVCEKRELGPFPMFNFVQYPPIMGSNIHRWVSPPATAKRITVSSFHGSNLTKIAQIASDIIEAFNGIWTADPEVTEHLAALQPSTMVNRN